MRGSRRHRLLFVALASIGLAVLAGCPARPPIDPGKPEEGGAEPVLKAKDPGPGTYMLCFYNVENLFDDQDDGRTTRGDSTYDGWFARNPEALALKLEKLCDVLVALNDGKGPDILALAEVESQRAAELLQQALNRRLGKRELHYPNVVYVQPGSGRHIATAVITRLPVDRRRTDAPNPKLRIMRTTILVNDRPLVLVASHWSSRLSDKTGDMRAKYGDQIHGHFRGMYMQNRKIDFVVCGDFNDDPPEPSVTAHLRATGNLDDVRAAGEVPLLFNLFAEAAKNKEFTWAEGFKRRHLFDQICVSAGLLDDEGWSCDLQSAAIVKEYANRNGHPNRFGSGSDKRKASSKGASDHFPVTVKLRVR